jgi:hypothetical protein
VVFLLEIDCFKAAERLSSGGAGGGTQPAPDKASCERRYPALTCNDLFVRHYTGHIVKIWLALAGNSKRYIRIFLVKHLCPSQTDKPPNG